MTDCLGPDDHWLEEHQRGILDYLSTALDTEAGLGEILTKARHAALASALNEALDVDAGLREVLLPSPCQETSPYERRASAETTPGVTAAPELSRESVSPQARLALRTNSDVSAACSVLELAISIDKQVSYVHTRCRVLERASGHTCPKKHTGECGPSCARLARDTDGVLSIARTMFDIAGGRARVFTGKLDLEPVADSADALAHTLVSEIRELMDFAREPSEERCAHTVEVARCATRFISEVKIHSRELVDLCCTRVWQTISMIVGRDLPVRDEKATLAFLDDFTMCDLRDIDLDGVDLAGVRWSESGTQWPAAVDVEDLKARSYEAPAGSGVYVIQSGTATVRELAGVG